MADAANKQFFISHASVDAGLAQRMAARLEARGGACWIAPRDVRAGAEYGAEIMRGIEEAAALVLILTPAANDSKNVMREVERAASKNKTIFSVVIDDEKPDRGLEYFLSASQWIVADHDSIEAAADEVLRARAGAPSQAKTVRAGGAITGVRKALPWVTSLVVVAGLVGVAWTAWQVMQRADPMGDLSFEEQRNIGVVNGTIMDLRGAGVPGQRVGMIVFSGHGYGFNQTAVEVFGADGDVRLWHDGTAQIDPRASGSASVDFVTDAVPELVVTCFKQSPERQGAFVMRAYLTQAQIIAETAQSRSWQFQPAGRVVTYPASVGDCQRAATRYMREHAP